jgi:hypothetical protein
MITVQRRLIDVLIDRDKFRSRVARCEGDRCGGQGHRADKERSQRAAHFAFSLPAIGSMTCRAKVALAAVRAGRWVSQGG